MFKTDASDLCGTASFNKYNASGNQLLDIQQLLYIIVQPERTFDSKTLQTKLLLERDLRPKTSLSKYLP